MTDRTRQSKIYFPLSDFFHLYETEEEYKTSSTFQSFLPYEASQEAETAVFLIFYGLSAGLAILLIGF